MSAEQDESADNAAALRRRAEARLQAEEPTLPPGDPQRLVHELQVHQIQLEMQNEELLEARSQLENLVEKYTDLYDFAPVGYFSLDTETRIREVNLTGAAMLGVERSLLLMRRFTRFVAPANRGTFGDFLQQVFTKEQKQVCEVALENGMDGTQWADLQGMRAAQPGHAEPLCRLAVSDITDLKRAAEAQERAETLKAINAALEAEVTRRKETEKSLRQSKRRQSVVLADSRSIEEQLRRLSHEVLHVQEVERQCISRDLHDEIAQTLAAINLHLASLAGDDAAKTDRMQKKIIETQRLVEQSVASVHRFAMGLRPTMLDDLGLVPALRSCACDFTKKTELPVHIKLPENFKPLADGPAVALYRIAQAALANVARHAEATEVRLSLRQTQRLLHLEITDNGVGFAIKHVHSEKQTNRIGLIGMRERAEMIGGRFSVVSTPGKGTTVFVRLPFAKACPTKEPTSDEETP